MITLSSLEKATKKKIKRVGRGPGSGMGKTSSRGHKGQGSRSGAKKRFGKIGGNVPLYQKMPIRGFTRGRFIKKGLSLTFHMIDKLYADGEVVNKKTLHEKGVISKNFNGKIKILSNGDLTKKVTVDVDGYSKQALEKLKKLKAIQSSK